MSKTIRWGILSTARINRSLIGPIRHAQRSELVAVASRTLTKARTYAQEKGIPQAYGSYEALLADPEIDVIYNPLPNSLHCEWSVKAAEAGKHVLCEKPLVTTIAEFDRLEAAARANGVTVFEAFAYLHHPQFAKIRAWVNEGHLGEVRLIHSWFSFFLPPESGNIRLKPELAGGALWDVGVYPVSLAIALAQSGPPVEVWAQHIAGESGVDVSLVGQMRFGKGMVAQISCGFRAPFWIGTRIVGSEGLIEVVDPWKPGGRGRETKLMLSRQDGTVETFITPSDDNPYLYEVEAMEACILDGAAPLVPLSLSRDFLRTVLALYESAQTGQPVSL